MKLRKRTVDNTVKVIHSADSSQGEKSHDHKPKTASIPEKQNEKHSQNKKRSLKISADKNSDSLSE